MSTTKQPLWTPNFIFISVINFQVVLIFYLLIIVIVSYSVTKLGASTSQAGLVSGIFIVGILIGRLIVSRLLKKFGRKTTLLIGLAGFLLSSGLYFLNLDVVLLSFVRFTHGFMLGIAATVLGTIIAQIIPLTRRGEGIGYYSMSATLGTAIGPFLAIWLMEHIEFQSIFMISSALTFVCLIMTLVLKIPELPTENPDTQTQTAAQNSWLAEFIEKSALPISFVMLLIAICYSSVLSFINFYAKEVDLLPAASFFFLTFAAAILISRPFTGPLMDRKGENIIILPAFILMALALYLLSIANTSFMLLLSAFLMGLGFGNIQSICQTIALKNVPLERMGLATSTFFIFLEAGLGFGPFFLGKSLDYISYAQLYGYSAIAILFCIVVYFILHGYQSMFGKAQHS